jgi:membrane protease YdiL (CAAX protease family)
VFGVREVEGVLKSTGFERREGPAVDRVPPLGLAGSAALFGVGALLLFLATRVVVPALVSATGAEPVLMWFLAASTVLFGPLLLIAALLLYRERCAVRRWSWGVRLRFRPMNGGDWLWTVGGLAAVGVLTSGIGAALGMQLGEAKPQLSFMAFEPLTSGRYWILAAWLPFFVLNIVGEEFLWRGVVLPRQEVAFGGKAWLVNGSLWLLFHAAFPWQVLLSVAPHEGCRNVSPMDC